MFVLRALSIDGKSCGFERKSRSPWLKTVWFATNAEQCNINTLKRRMRTEKISAKIWNLTNHNAISRRTEQIQGLESWCWLNIDAVAVVALINDFIGSYWPSLDVFWLKIIVSEQKIKLQVIHLWPYLISIENSQSKKKKEPKPKIQRQEFTLTHSTNYASNSNLTQSMIKNTQIDMFNVTNDLL